MKILLTVFVLLFSSSVVAEDISDFQSEGMSIGDSLLEYFSEEEIFNDFKVDQYYIPERNKYNRIFIFNKIFKNYEYISIDVKINDSKYIIHGITGMLDYSDSKNCFKKQKQIIKDFSSILSERPHEYTIPSNYDETGQSKMYYAEWYLNEGSVQIICYDFAKHTNIKSGLDVSIRTTEFQDWLNKD